MSELPLLKLALIALSSLTLIITVWLLMRWKRKIIYRNHQQDIMIFDQGSARYLQFMSSPHVIQSAIDRNQPKKILLPYQKLMVAAALLAQGPKKICIVGLGGGNLSTQLRRCYPKALIDHWEINERMLDYAKRFFDFRTDNKMRFFWGDAIAHFLTQKSDQCQNYDLIVLDAFDGHQPLAHALSQDFGYALKRQLSPQGIVLINSISSSQIEQKLYQNIFDVIGTAFSGRAFERNYVRWAGYCNPQMPTQKEAQDVVRELGLQFVSRVYAQLSQKKISH